MHSSTMRKACCPRCTASLCDRDSQDRNAQTDTVPQRETQFTETPPPRTETHLCQDRDLLQELPTPVYRQTPVKTLPSPYLEVMSRDLRK